MMPTRAFRFTLNGLAVAVTANARSAHLCAVLRTRLWVPGRARELTLHMPPNASARACPG